MLLIRRATQSVALGSWQFPKGTMFTVAVHLMHHDARWFPDPQTYRTERFSPDAPDIPRGAFMPFGTGARACLGRIWPYQNDGDRGDVIAALRAAETGGSGAT